MASKKITITPETLRFVFEDCGGSTLPPDLFIRMVCDFARDEYYRSPAYKRKRQRDLRKRDAALVSQFIKNNNINPATISLYVDGDDVYRADCDITWDTGKCGRCTALTFDGILIEFDALDAVIGGELGKVAGAF